MSIKKTTTFLAAFLTFLLPAPTASLAQSEPDAAGQAATLLLKTEDGAELTVSYARKTIRKHEITLDSGERIDMLDIASIHTDSFDAYEEAVLRTVRLGDEAPKIEFTGDENVYALRLEKLQKKRDRQVAGQGAGGLLMLLGVLSGDRNLARIGAATYGVASAVKDRNTDKMLATQNEALAELQKGRKDEEQEEQEEEDLEAELRREYGDENVESLRALIEREYDRATAFAAAAETSKDANHRVAAVWMKAVIHADQGNEDALRAECERLIVLDPGVTSVEDAETWIELLTEDLDALREG